MKEERANILAAFIADQCFTPTVNISCSRASSNRLGEVGHIRGGDVKHEKRTVVQADEEVQDDAPWLQRPR